MFEKQKILMIGGTKGVGKTELIKQSISESGLTVNYLNTGEIVNYFKKAYNEGKWVEQAMIDMNIWAHMMNFEGVMDTHFAGKNIETDEYVPGISYRLLFWAGHHKDIQPILVTTDPQKIYERRKNDDKKKRILDIEQIIFENNKNYYYFDKYCLLLGKQKIIINNDDFEKAREELTNIIIDTYK